MKELFDEQQMRWIVIAICVLASLISLLTGFYQTGKASKKQKKLLWANSILFAFSGPVIWAFWLVYNAIEDFYGLDSLKALKINFLIVMGIALFFAAVHFWMGRTLGTATAAKRR